MSNLIVIEGADGAGKATQTKFLVERLRNDGYEVETIDFPRYENNHFGKLIRECLDGKRGNFMDVDPRVVSALYAADRYESSKQINEWLSAGKMVVADRYVSANMLHQGAKISDESEREEFLNWLNEMEHGVFELPRPSLIIYLDVPHSVRKDLMGQDKTRTKLDLAELMDEHQIATETSAKSLVASLNNWHPINCVGETGLRTREDIHEDVYRVTLEVVRG